MQITKLQLTNALAAWEQLNRDGGCAPGAEVKPVSEVAEANADYLWEVLANGTKDTQAQAAGSHQ